jgi:Sigma-70, region 4
MEAGILTLHGYERENEQRTEGFEYGGAGWGMAHDCSKARGVQAVSQVENRLRRQFLAFRAMLDSQLEERVKAGTLLLPNSLTKLIAASNWYMKSSQSIVGVLLAQEPVCQPGGRGRPTPTTTEGQFTQWQTAQRIVQILLEQPVADNPLAEASVHRPKRGRIWMAVFTGPAGGQTWRSTGLTDREQALLVARRWEAEARAQRARVGHTNRKPVWRVRRAEPGSGTPPLTQKEVAQLLHMSERSVREIERRAFQKIRNHPVMRQIWQKYLAGELEEQQRMLTSAEVEAVLNAAQTSEERHLIQKVLRIIQRPRSLRQCRWESSHGQNDYRNPCMDGRFAQGGNV